MRTSIARLVFLVVLGACDTATSTGIQTVSCPTDSTLTYANFGSAFMTNYCLDCHSGKESPSLNTQAKVQSNISHILQEAVYTNAMPEDEDITTAEREMLGEWLACGAL